MTELRDGLGLLDRGADGIARGLVAVSASGRILFATPQAERWLAHYFPSRRSTPGRLPPALRQWVRQETAARPADDAPPRRQALVVRHRTVHLVVRLVSDQNRSLLLLEERPRIVARRELDAHGLTPREGEVLAWMAEGKTNPEIGAILGLSPRTMGNHLARIYDGSV